MGGDACVPRPAASCHSRQQKRSRALIHLRWPLPKFLARSKCPEPLICGPLPVRDPLPPLNQPLRFWLRVAGHGERGKEDSGMASCSLRAAPTPSSTAAPPALLKGLRLFPHLAGTLRPGRFGSSRGHLPGERQRWGGHGTSVSKSVWTGSCVRCLGVASGRWDNTQGPHTGPQSPLPAGSPRWDQRPEAELSSVPGALAGAGQHQSRERSGRLPSGRAPPGSGLPLCWGALWKPS